MEQDSRSRQDRQAILKGVYEDNLRTVQKPSLTPGRKPAPARPETKASGRLRVVVWMLGVVAVFAGVWYQSFGAGAAAGSDRSPVAARTAQIVPTGSDSLPRPLEGAVGPLADVGGEVPLVSDPSVAQLYGLQLRTIVIDPGHGGRDPGTIGRHGLMEKDITLDVARRLKARLEQYSAYQILLTRDTDVKLMLRERINFANEHQADLFVSLHVNWLPVDSVAPIETYYYGPGSDAKAVRLAAQENRNSGYTLAEFNELTQQLGLEMKIEESKEIAVSIQKALYRNMRRINENVSDWGVKSGDFMVLLGVEAPSVLAEIASISNPSDEARLGTAEHRERLAMFLEEGIVNYLRQHANENEPTEHATEEEE